VNEASFRARPHHRMHNTLEVDTGAIGPRWRVDSMEGGRIGRGGGGEDWKDEMGRTKDTKNKEPFVLQLQVITFVS
jgi:hypothetical protein